MAELTHFNRQGDAVMVDVSAKPDTLREAVAAGRISMSQECFQKVQAGQMGKGDVLGVARIAGIMGAKKTAELIPLCHILNLSKVEIEFIMKEDECSIWALCTVRTFGKTGVEMEALTGVNVALLTIYDMCKAVDKTMEMGNIHLQSKKGGKSGTTEMGNIHLQSEKVGKSGTIEMGNLHLQSEKVGKSGTTERRGDKRI